jgi:hypothetical protein
LLVNLHFTAESSRTNFNLPELESAAHGRGYLSDSRDSDGIVRSVPLVLNVNGAPAPAATISASGHRERSFGAQ